MANDDHNSMHSCFNEWLNLQKQDHKELLQAMTSLCCNNKLNNNNNNNVDDVLTNLTEKTITHFEDYMAKRSTLAHSDATPFFAPTWCSSLENSLLWIAGCRPSMFIRLIYAMCGAEVEAHLVQFLLGARTGNVGELSGKQLRMVNSLHTKTIREELKLTNLLASLQDDIADIPIAVGKGNMDIEKALDKHDQTMAKILEEADKLRLSTVKDLIAILTPKQGVEFLAASKKLYLDIHEIGKKRDHQHGRN